MDDKKSYSPQEIARFYDIVARLEQEVTDTDAMILSMDRQDFHVEKIKLKDAHDDLERVYKKYLQNVPLNVRNCIVRDQRILSRPNIEESLKYFKARF